MLLTTALSASPPGAPAAADVLGTSDIVVGTVLALLLAWTASFLQGRRNQNDFVLWERKETSKENLSPTVNSTNYDGSNNKDPENKQLVFDANDWKEMSQPDNYILYKREIEARKNKVRSGVPVVEQKWVLLALLALFVPLFSIEFFFALSRQFICGDGPFLSSLAAELCSPV
jgi:hypothetical protein